MVVVVSRFRLWEPQHKTVDVCDMVSALVSELLHLLQMLQHLNEQHLVFNLPYVSVSNAISYLRYRHID